MGPQDRARVREIDRERERKFLPRVTKYSPRTTAGPQLCGLQCFPVSLLREHAEEDEHFSDPPESFALNFETLWDD